MAQHTLLSSQTVRVGSFSRFVTELLMKGGEGVSSKCPPSVKTLKTAASDNRHFQWKAARTQMAGWLVGLYDEYNQDFSKQAETLRDNVCVAESPTFQQTSIMMGEKLSPSDVWLDPVAMFSAMSKQQGHGCADH